MLTTLAFVVTVGWFLWLAISAMVDAICGVKKERSFFA